MSAEVIISLPFSTRFDAEAFGLWLEATLRAAREDGDLDTEVGKISVRDTTPPPLIPQGGQGGSGGRPFPPDIFVAGGTASVTVRGGSVPGGQGGAGGQSTAETWTRTPFEDQERS